MKDLGIESHKGTYYQKSNKDLFDQLKKENKHSKYLPKIHIFPEAGLMNDPNGLAYFNDQYHVFFQWYPFGTVHGLKHWGHTTSTDLVHWSSQEFALIPNQEYEKNGCYSGNAIEFEGKLYLFYTANYKTAEGKIPKQAIAVMDQEGNIEKYVEPIISGEVEGLSGELRDPFVFKKSDTFYMLLGGSQFHGHSYAGFGDNGVLLLYKSKNLFEWEYMGIIDIPIDTGYMLECPSLIQVDDKDVLFLSLMGVSSESQRFSNRFASIYLVGKLEIDAMYFQVENWDEMDAGFDFYAPQAFYGKRNIPLLLAWFGCGEPEYPMKENWKHGLTFPQQVSLEDGKFKRYPVKEIIEQFSNQQEVATSSFNIDSPTYYLKLNEGLHFKVGKENDYWEFIYNASAGKVTISRENLRQKIDETYGSERSTFINAITSVDVFVDNSFVEVYLNKGEKVFSFNVFQEGTTTVWSPAGQLEGTLYVSEP